MNRKTVKASESPASLCIQDKCIQSTVFVHSAKINQKKKKKISFICKTNQKVMYLRNKLTRDE